MKALLASVVALSGATGLLAQSITIPASAAAAEGGSSDGVPWDVSSDARSMCAYPGSQLAPVGTTVTIERLAWRAEGGHLGNGGTWGTVRIELSTSANPFNALSSTFEDNHGTDRTIVYQGPVAIESIGGSTPNDDHVDVLLTTPFTFDTTAGNDLLVDVTVTGGYSGDTNGRIGDFVSGGAEGGRVFATTRSSFVGTVDGNVPVLTIEYAAGMASAIEYGVGCGGGGNGSTLYEVFDVGSPFDLAGTSWVAVPSSPSYVALQTTGSIVTPTGAPSIFADDQVQSFVLPWTIPYPGGTTNTIWVSSNGFISFETTTEAGETESLEEFLSGTARFAPLWRDFNPSSGGAIYAEQDPSNAALYHVSFLGVPEFPNVGSNDFQMTIDQSGAITVTYGAVSSVNGLVGFTPGGGAVDRGEVDLSTEFVTGWTSGADTDEIHLRTQGGARPVMGTTLTLEIDQVPFSAFAAANMVSTTQQLAGLDLTVIGMPGCNLYIGNVFLSLPVTLTGAVTEVVNFGVPNTPFWIGQKLYMQAAVAGANEVQPLPVATSNGLDLTIDQL